MVVAKSRSNPLRVGVIGVGRGIVFINSAGPQHGMELVAICDKWEGKLAEAQRTGAAIGKQVTTYTDYDRFLEHDMDAVILANHFHEHAPFALKALRSGKHVMSETSSCFTLAQGVELVETVEKTGLTYMLAENYAYMLCSQEMRRIFQAGRIGSFVYGEGEYVHPESADFWNSGSCGINHWRNWNPATYYCTHALSPIVYITETLPVAVNGFVMPFPEDDPVWQRMARRADMASMIAVRMDNGATVKLLQGRMRGESRWVRIHGSRGQMENLRDMANLNKVRLRREQYHEERTEPAEQIFTAELPPELEAARQSGHGGGDYFMSHSFTQAIRSGEPPFFDVHRGVAMSIVGILAYRSALNNSNTEEVPDFHKKAKRDQYRHDDWSPDPSCRKPGDPWPSVRGDMRPSKKALAYAREGWKKAGYTGE